MAVAEVSYIGGYEGATEYWWMRISPEGRRSQVTEPLRIPTPAAPPLVLSATPVVGSSTGAAGGGEGDTSSSSSAAAASAAGTASNDSNIDPRLYLLTAGSCHF